MKAELSVRKLGVNRYGRVTALTVAVLGIVGIIFAGCDKDEVIVGALPTQGTDAASAPSQFEAEARASLQLYATAIGSAPFDYPKWMLCDRLREDDESRAYTDLGPKGRAAISALLSVAILVRELQSPHTFVFRVESSNPNGWMEISIIQTGETWCISESWSQ